MTPPVVPSPGIDHQKRAAARPAPLKDVAVPEHIAVAADTMQCESASAFRRPLHETLGVCLSGGVRWLSVQVPAGAEAALASYLATETENLSQRGVRLELVGAPRHAALVQAADFIRTLPAQRHSLRLSFAVNYGGRAEIVDAIRTLAEQVRSGALRAADVDMPRLERELCAGDLPPVDLLVRTGGSTALSEFLLWKAAYAELLFIDGSFADVTARQMQMALDDYARRRRTFGGLAATRA